ncbi:MAG: aldo/keto reductase [Candidatus Promineifilaceae bacterium]
MEYRRLGRTGLKVSTICLGAMQFGWTAGEDDSFAILDRAAEHGVNFIDTADVYSRWHSGDQGGESETILGRWLGRGLIARDQVVIATKVRGRMGPGPNDAGLSRLHIMQAVEASLRRLQTDYIDLYQVHSPDEETPLEETLEALSDLVRSGKVRYIGCSNFPAWLLAKSLWISEARRLARFDSLQPHYNLAHRAEFERELQPLCLDQGVGVIPYSPLAAGYLTGKYRRGQELPDSARAGSVQRRYMHESGWATLERLMAVASETGRTPAQVAIGWVLANPAVSSAIIGANSIQQLDETIQAADVRLEADEKAALDEGSSWA